MTHLLEELREKTPADLFSALAALPPSLALARLPYHRVSADVVRQHRSAFGTAKAAFLQHLAREHAAALSAMGLNDDSIRAMEVYGMFPANVPGQRMDATIDHIVSIKFGGGNDFENLMLIPARINALKDRLEQLQLADDAKQGTLTTIIPANGAKVPYIGGGFQRAKLEHA